MTLRQLSAALIGILALATLVPLTEQTAQSARDRYVYATEPPLAGLDSRLINILTMGYRLLYDEFAATWTLQYLDRSTLSGYSGKDAATLLEKTARHRIQVESFYTLSCFVLHLQFREGQLCERIAQYGIDALPTSWRVPATYGYVALSNNDLKKAAVYLSIAADRESMPEMYRALAKRMLEENVSVTERQKFIEMVLAPGSDQGASAAQFLIEYLKTNTPQKQPGAGQGDR